MRIASMIICDCCHLRKYGGNSVRVASGKLYCADCVNQGKHLEQTVHTAPAVIPFEHKWCADCGMIKPLAEFDRNSNRKDGYKSACRACIERWQQ